MAMETVTEFTEDPPKASQSASEKVLTNNASAKDILEGKENTEESSILSEDSIESAALNEDSVESAALHEDSVESAALNEDSVESVAFYEESIKSTALNENAVPAAFIANSGTKDHVTSPAANNIIKITDFLTNPKMSKVYEVNGSSFVEEEHISHHDDTLVRYELYRVNMAKDDVDEDGSEDEDMTTALDINTQTLPQGLIINSNVYLSAGQWHTMALVDGNLFRCAVCQVYCDRANCADHIVAVRHLRSLDKYKPLKRFDLSIVRKINENLHCGVCNDIFDVIDYKNHENSKTHEGNLLTAINKVSDLMYDANIQRNVFNDKNDFSTDRNNFNTDRNNFNTDRNNFPPDREYRNNNNAFHFNANAINNNNINVYEEFSEYEEEEEEEEEEYTYESEEYNTPFQGISYASMASKPSIELPKFLKIDLGTKEVRVKFESWHMIVKLELNKFYCMVCNKTEHIRFKSQHCISCEHLERLAQCTVVEPFEDYLIRKIDDKLYHCGHCNNLQYQNQMSDHIESAHPKKNKNIVDNTVNSPVKIKKPKANDKNNSNIKTVVETKKSEIDRNAIIEKSIEYKIERKIDPHFDVFGDVTLSPFGCVLRISALSFNFIIKKEEDFYCAICDCVCADVKGHVEDLEHMETMNMTPFIRPFKSNLTRAVRGTLHCSLCNKLILVEDIYNHNMDQPHTTALAAALGMKKTQKPNANTKINDVTKFYDQKNISDNAKVSSDQNNVVSGMAASKTLPPLTIGVPTSNIQPDLSLHMPITKDSPTANVLKISGNSSPAKTPLASPNQLKAQNVLQNSINAAKKADASQNTAHMSNSGLNAGNNFNFGQSQPNSGQYLLQALQNHQKGGPNPPFPGQNHQTFPTMFNSMFPRLPVSQNLNPQFLGAPLSYANFNAPRAPFPPYPYLPVVTNLSPNTVQNIPNKTVPTAQNQISTEKSLTTEKQKKMAAVKTPGKNNIIESANDNIKTANDNNKTANDSNKTANDNNKTANDNNKTANDSIESEYVESQSDDEECKEFDEEELVFLKLKTTYFKITNLSYNTLVYMDNGIRYCFVCSNTVRSSLLQKHVESREHTDNVGKNKFLDKYGVQLFRQMYLMYHCAICNVLMTRKEIKLHLDWPIHLENYDVAHKILNKKNRKVLKAGIKEYIVETQKEAIFHNVNEPKINIVAAYQIVPNLEEKKDTFVSKPRERSKSTVVKKNKMVIINNVVMKVDFDHWHGISSSKNVTKCIICQMEINPYEILDHVEADYHCVALGKTFEKSYYPALVRKINENVVNCMICNLELTSNEYLVHEHISGRKHNKNQDKIVNESSSSDSYADCYEEYLNL